MNRKIINGPPTPLDHHSMISYINTLTEKYSFLSVTSIGETILGKSIPMLCIGNGEKSLLYVGSHKATDWKTSIILLEFIHDICESFQHGCSVCGLDLKYINKMRSICIIPMLNPDGVDYNINGITESNPLYERVYAMNNKSLDFSNWISNARGVDLDKNYMCQRTEQPAEEDPTTEGREGEWPESEPEIGSLCSFLRYNINIKLVLSLHSTNEKTGTCQINNNKYLHIINRVAVSSGYKLTAKSNLGTNYGLSRWCEGIGTTAISIIAPTEKNSLHTTYAQLKESLFTLPTFI